MSKENLDKNISEEENKANEAHAVNEETAKAENGSEEQTETPEELEEQEEQDKDENSDEQDKNRFEREDEISKLLSELSESKDKYMRLSAEFDNYRRRTLKEKMDLTKTAGENIMLKILPVVDDFERAMGSMKEAKDCNAIMEGINLIYNKFKEFIAQQGVQEIEAMDKEFDTDLHEALTKIPATKKKQKGKVVDVIEKGYKLHDKVIRFSKVVVGE